MDAQRRFVDLTYEEKQREAELTGYRWKHLPGYPDAHKVMGMDSQGVLIRAQEVERTFNSCYCIDYVLGKGTFATHTGKRQEDVLELAIRLYSAVAEGPVLVQ